MRFLFCVPGPAGHFFPTVPVALKLKEWGHHVAFVSEADLGVVETVKQLGLPAYLSGPAVRYKDWPRLHPGFCRKRGLVQTHYMIKRVVGPLIGEMAEGTLRAIDAFSPNAVVVDTIAFGSAIAAERSGLPWATSGLFLTLVEGRGSTPPGLGLGPPNEWWQFWMNRFIWWGGKLFSRQYDSVFNNPRRRLGLPNLPHGFFSTTFSPYLYLAFSTLDFEYPRSDFPPHLHFVGPSLWDHPVGRPRPDWLDRLDAGKPVVYVTQGTAVGPMREEFFDLAMDALKKESVHVIVTTGDAVDHSRLTAPPGNAILQHFVPHSYFLDRVSAMVHHGGFSTCMGGLRHGVPMVMVPFNWDQPDNARRVEELGAGVMLRPALVTKGRLRGWVRRILEDGRYRDQARRFGAGLQGNSGAEGAAALLVKLAETKQPVLRN
ncbi:MAG: glycosyltransferase family 1 protein [Nitrospirae bacterium]|nr:glycosyltransferase family 1 protein [Nitrospirota bacterium]